MSLPLPFGNPDIDPAAAAQQLAYVACVYQNRPDELAELVAPAQVVRFVFRPLSWPPSYALIGWPDSQWNLVIAGTTNLNPQVYGHIAGSFGRPFEEDALIVNGQWGVVWEELREDIRELIGELPSQGRVYISGHSYGGAVGAIGAVDYAGRFGPERIELMTIGAPKSFTDLRPAELPAVWHRVDSSYDPVPTLPLSIRGVDIVDHWTNPLAWLPRYPFWTHYGREWILSPNGQWNWLYGDPDPLPPGVSLNPLNAHRLRNYWGRLNARYESDGGPTQYQEALLVCDRVLLSPGPQEESSQLPRSVRGPDGSLVPVPDYDGIPPSSALTLRSVMALVPDVLAQPYFKITHFFNWGQSGWDESYWCSVTGADSPMVIAIRAGIDLAIIRKKVLWKEAQYVGLRVSDFKPPHKAVPEKESGVGFGTFPSTNADAPLPKGSCMFVRAQDRTFTYSAERVYRGVSRELLGTSNINNTTVVPTAKMQAWLQAMTNFLRAPYPGSADTGGGTLKFGLLGTDRDTAGNIGQVNAVDVDQGGFLRVRVPDPAYPAEIGDRVHLFVNRTRCTRGVSGEYRVRNTELTAGAKLLTMNRKPCCPEASLTTLMGTIRRNAKLMYQQYWFEFSGCGHRNTGSPNFSGAGRRSARCC